MQPSKVIAERARFFKFREKEIIFGEKTPVSWLFDGGGRRLYRLRVARRDCSSGKPRVTLSSVPEKVQRKKGG